MHRFVRLQHQLQNWWKRQEQDIIQVRLQQQPGRLLTAGAMMGSMMKNPTDVLTLQVQCGGPIGGMTVTADSQGEVKGYVHNPDVMLPPINGKLDVGERLARDF